MQATLPKELSCSSLPRFTVIERRPPSPTAILLAVLTAAGALYGIGLGLRHNRARHFRDSDANTARAAGSASTASSDDDEKDDPNQVDVITLGDPADAPEPARRGQHYSPVHRTILIHLPRFGPQEGLIPSTPAGHLLYAWLAAFNQGNAAALADTLPNPASATTTAAQMDLRRQTGGLNLLSAKEVQPGLLVFRLRDQTPQANEFLGSLLLRPEADPPSIASFTLRGVP